MTSKWVVLAVLAAGCVGAFAPVVQADDQLMILYPNQREKHQLKMDENAANYEARGQAYVDHLYATGGEESMPLPDGFMDESLESSDVIPVDVNEVADIVKESSELPEATLSAQ